MPAAIFGVTSYLMLRAGANSKPRPLFAPRSDFSSAGLNDTYQRPASLSMIGRISHDHVSSANWRLTQPISVDRPPPTGQFHALGTRTRGRMWLPTYRHPSPWCALVKM